MSIYAWILICWNVFILAWVLSKHGQERKAVKWNAKYTFFVCVATIILIIMSQK